MLVLRPIYGGYQKPYFVRSLSLCGLLGPDGSQKPSGLELRLRPEAKGLGSGFGLKGRLGGLIKVGR